jgi:preprotein translocase subunit SecF
MTALTTFIAIIPFAFFILGASSVKDFAIVMSVGILEGTYSSIFIAAPLVLGWERAINRGKKKHEQDIFKKQTQLTLTAQPPVKAALAESQEVASEPVALKPREHAPIIRVQRTVSKKKKKKKKR